MKLKTQHRFLQISAERVDAETRTMEMSFSSEEPVDRYWGTEILVHDKNSAKLDRLNSHGPMLFNHNIDDVVGVVEKASIGSDRRGYATVRFAKSARGEEVFGLVQDGILANVSVAYRINIVEENPKTNEMRVTDWEPLEISIVTVPADNTVGIGRSYADEEKEVQVINPLSATTAAAEKTQALVVNAEPQSAIAASIKEFAMPKEASAAASDNAELKSTNNGTEAERLRIKTISNLARQHKVDDKTRDEWVDNGVTVDDASSKVLDILAERGRTNPQTESKIGLSDKELKRYSLRSAIQACADKNWNKAGLELEASREIAKRLNKIPDEYSFFVPFEIQERQVQKRDLTVATAGAGGYLVETANMGFIELMRNRSVAFSMGAMRLAGLQGNVTVPRQSAAATAYWLSTEATQLTESQQTFVQMALSPKTAGAYTEISRQLLLQSSPDAEGIVTSDLAAVIALAIDLAVLNGSGAAGQPTGIINTAGIGSVVGTTFGYPNILEFQTDVATANVMPARGGYVTTPAVASQAMQRARFANTDTPLWAGNIWDGQVSGFPGMSSNQMPVGNMLFGDWAKVVVAEWGTLEIAVNPTANFQAGIIGVRAMYSVDVGVRLPAAFSLSAAMT